MSFFLCRAHKELSLERGIYNDTGVEDLCGKAGGGGGSCTQILGGGIGDTDEEK